MRTSTVLPLVFIAASIAPAFALPLGPTEDPETTTVSKPKGPVHTNSVAETTDAATHHPAGAQHRLAHAYAHQNEQYAHGKTSLHRSQHTTQNASPRLHGTHRYAGQRRPERAGQRLHQRPAAEHVNRPRPAGKQHRRPSPSADFQRPQRQSQRETRAFEEPETLVSRAIADDLSARHEEDDALVARSFNWGEAQSIVNERLRHSLRGDTISDVFSREFDEDLFARELEDELEARKVNWKKVGGVVGGVAKGLLHFLREDTDREILAREPEEELEARKVNWKKVGGVVGGIAKTALHFLREDENGQLLARDLDESVVARQLMDELEARGVNWKKVGGVVGGVAKGLLHFLREDTKGQLLARDIDEELLTRELEKELEARKVNWKKVGGVFSGIAKTALHFLREDGEMPVYARDLEFEDGLFEREVAPGSGAINFKNILKDGEQFISGVIRREEVPAGSGAINFKNILKDGEQFVSGILKREDENVFARGIYDELVDRDMILDELD